MSSITTMIHLAETEESYGQVVSADDAADGKPYLVLNLGNNVTLFIRNPEQVRDLVVTLVNLGMDFDEAFEQLAAKS